MKTDGATRTEGVPREAERVAGAATGCSILSPQVAERHRLVEVDAERVQAGPVTLRNANAQQQLDPGPSALQLHRLESVTFSRKFSYSRVFYSK